MAAEASYEATGARHAEVVPAFFAAATRKPIQCGPLEVHPYELVCWGRSEELSEAARRELRLAIIKRTSVKADVLLSQPAGVRLAEGWRARLKPADLALIEKLPLTDRHLEAWSLKELRSALHVPLEHVLALLAALEAAYWIPPPSPKHVHGALKNRHAEPVRVDDELRTLAEQVLRLPWLDAVTPGDTRFATSSGRPLRLWITSCLRAVFAPPSLQPLLQHLLAADALTAEEEAYDISLNAARQCAPSRGGEETVRRWTAIFVRRHIAPTGASRDLKEVGDEFSISKERVRQICDAFLDFFRAGETCTPALARALEAAARVVPLEVNDLNDQLRRFIGPGAGFESLLAWSEIATGKAAKVRCDRVSTKLRGQLVEVTTIVARGAAPWVEPMLRHAVRDCATFGCTNVLRIAGALALAEGVAPGQEAIEAALGAVAGFRWLDREIGWFALGDGDACAAANRLRKIFAVARRPVGTDEISAALASDDRIMYKKTNVLGMATPPVHVLRELFVRWTWVKAVQQSRLLPSDDLDISNVLSEIEVACVDVIEKAGGVACRFELKDVAVKQMGYTNALLVAVLGSSPIFSRLEHGLYALIGRSVRGVALDAARARLRQRAYAQAPAPLTLAANQFVVRVTASSLRNEQYSVPASFSRRLSGRRHTLYSATKELPGEAKVNASGAMKGLNRHFPEAVDGDLFVVDVCDDGLHVQHHRSAPSEQREAAGDGDLADEASSPMA